MLSYRHAFHAGNHADIIKHISLMLVLEAMQQKDKPFCAIDCNAGGGFYYLDDEMALKTGEAQSGILKLLSVHDAKGGIGNSAVERYLDFVLPYIKDGRYPGSPEIIRSFLREKDRAILMELHNTEIEILKSHINDGRISIHHRDCYEGLKALTPPQIKRGFLLMDPSYEVDSDYTNCSQTLCAVMKKWSVGIQCLWYPLLRHRKIDVETMLARIESCADEMGLEHFRQELLVDSTERENGLYGSGMLFVNPPWKLKESLESAVSQIEPVLHL